MRQVEALARLLGGRPAVPVGRLFGTAAVGEPRRTASACPAVGADSAAVNRRRQGGCCPARPFAATPPSVLARCVPAPHAGAMFTVTEAEAVAIRRVFEQDGELSAMIELRR